MNKTVLLILFLSSCVICTKLFCIEPDHVIGFYRWEITRSGKQDTLIYKVRDNKIFGYFNNDSIAGYQVGRRVVFHHPGDTDQIWTGWISKDVNDIDGLPIVSGIYSGDDEKVYPWYGRYTVWDPNEWISLTPITRR